MTVAILLAVLLGGELALGAILFAIDNRRESRVARGTETAQ